MPLRWFSGGVLVSADPDGGAPLLLLGADAYGRDRSSRGCCMDRARRWRSVCSRRSSPPLLGALVGGVAGYAGGRLDALLSRVSEFVVVLPAIYVTLALRAVMPLVLPGLDDLRAAADDLRAAWLADGRSRRTGDRPRRARSRVRGGGARCGRQPYRALLTRHLLPAASGYLSTQATLLLPAFILAESTMSYVGLGFPDTTPTWGTMLQDASNVALLGDAPWALAPAAAIFMVVLGVNLLVQSTGRAPVQLEP